MEKVTYTPTEFAEVFGKERTWAYRQLYAGKVQAITELGRTLIPTSEVDRLLKEAGRYMGAKAKIRKEEKPKVGRVASASSNQWANAVKSRKAGGLPSEERVRSTNGRKSGSKRGSHVADQLRDSQSIYQRLSRYKSPRKEGKGNE